MPDGLSQAELGLTEKDLGLEQKEETSSLLDPLYKLPVTKEIAEQGAAAYATLVNSLPKNAKQLFTTTLDIRELATKGLEPFASIVKKVPSDELRPFSPAQHIKRGFSGIAGEVALQQAALAAFPKEAFIEAQEAINRTPDFFMFHKQATPESSWEQYEIFNIPVVQRIASNYPKYFPLEARQDTKQWLQNNWEEWADAGGINGIRYGLLSGFPLEAVLGYEKYHTTINKLKLLRDTPVLSHDEFQFVADFASTHQVTGAEEAEDDMHLKHILSEINKRLRVRYDHDEELVSLIGLSEEESLLVQKARFVASELSGLSYIGFNAKKDTTYLHQLDTLYEESGIDSTLHTG